MWHGLGGWGSWISPQANAALERASQACQGLGVGIQSEGVQGSLWLRVGFRIGVRMIWGLGSAFEKLG